MWVLLGLDWVLPMMLLNFQVTCSYIFHFLFLWFEIVFLFCLLSLSLSLFWIEPLYGTQTEKIRSGSEPSSRFRVILFVSSFCSISHLVLWWEGQDELLWELPGQWCTFRTPGHSIGFLWHYITWCHLDSGWESLCEKPVRCPLCLSLLRDSEVHV